MPASILSMVDVNLAMVSSSAYSMEDSLALAVFSKDSIGDDRMWAWAMKGGAGGYDAAWLSIVVQSARCCSVVGVRCRKGGGTREG